MGERGEAETPTANQLPRGDQGRRLLWPVVLHTCPFASLLSQVRARLGPGGYFRCSGNGGPQSCLPAACGMAQGVSRYGPSSSTQAQDPREGPSLAVRTTQGFLRDGLTRQAREEADRSMQGVPREVPVMQAMTTKARRAQARAVSSFPLWCKGGKRRHGVPRHQAKVSISVQQDKDQQDGRTEVTMEPKTASPPEPFAGKDRFNQDKLY